MLFKNLVLKNFKSHANTIIDFNPGITVIVGENGAGKSTIFEAISYALFKKSTSSQNDLVKSNKHTDKKLTMSVELIFEEKGVEYKVKREKTPSKTSSTLYQKDYDSGDFMVLTAGNSAVDRELKSIVEMDADLFLNAIYIRQGEIADLVSKKPAERKKLITKLLKIEELEKAWDKIPQLINKYENKESELKGLSATDESAHFELQEKTEELFNLKNEYNESMENKEKFEKDKEEVFKIKKELDEEKSKYDLLTNTLENERKNLSKLFEDKERIYTQYSSILQQEKEMELLKTYVEKLPIYKEFKDSFNEYNSLKRELNTINETISKIEANEQIQKDEKENYDKYNNLESEINVFNSKEAEIKGIVKNSEENKSLKEESEKKIEVYNQNLNKFSAMASSVLSDFDDEFLSRHELVEFKDSLNDEDLNSIDSDEKFDKLKDLTGQLRIKLQQKIETYSEKINGLNSEIKSLKEGIKASKKPLTEIKEVGNKCPICQSDISDDKKEELIGSYESTITENNEKIELNKKEILEFTNLKDELNKININIERLEKNIFANKHILSSIVEEKAKIEKLDKKLEDLDNLKKQLAELNNLIEEKSNELKSLKESHDRFIHSQAALKTLGEKDKLTDEVYKLTGKINGADEKLKKCISQDSYLSLEIDLEDLNREIEDLESKDKKYHELEGSIRIKDDLKNQLDEIKVNIETKEALITQIQKDIRSSKYDSAEYHDVEVLEKKTMDKINKNTENIGLIRGKISRIEPRIEELKVHLKHIAQIKAEIKSLEDYISLLNEFRFLYGKDGIQGELRAKAKPVIQANTKMFFEKFNFNYSDLLISDDYEISVFGPEGEANIDMVSGGEKIAIALALRLGITQAIAKGNIDSILLDEPTIHLDTVRIQELSNLLRSMHIIPQMILVTHDSGLENSADTLIKIVKEDGVSKIEVDE